MVSSSIGIRPPTPSHPISSVDRFLAFLSFGRGEKRLSSNKSLPVDSSRSEKEVKRKRSSPLTSTKGFESVNGFSHLLVACLLRAPQDISFLSSCGHSRLRWRLAGIMMTSAAGADEEKEEEKPTHLPETRA